MHTIVPNKIIKILIILILLRLWNFLYCWERVIKKRQIVHFL